MATAPLTISDAGLDRPFRCLIDGKLIDAPTSIDVRNPATGAVIATVPDCGAAELDAAVDAARRAFEGWSNTPAAERRTMLAALLDCLKDNATELAALLVAEQGRPMMLARGEVGTGGMVGRALLGLDLGDEEVVLPSGRKATKRYMPLGVVCGISPWNAPVLTPMTKIVSALYSGNTLVLKPSPFTPLVMLRFAEHAKDLLPPGVLNMISGGDGLGPMMTSHKGFAKISFTGSTATGRRIMASAAVDLKRVTLELGGNDAAILLPDVDVDAIADSLFWSMFMNSGQACIALKRLFVPDALFDRVVAALVTRAKAQRLGSGFETTTTLGPVQNAPQYRRLLDVLRKIEQSGTAIAYQSEIPAGSDGYFIPITLLADPSDDAEFVCQEVFGPIRSILRYSDVDEAVRRANGTPYGLGSSVWGRDLDAVHKVARRMDAGITWINSHLQIEPTMPLCGHGDSGIGADFGIEGLRQFTDIQVVLG